MSVLQKLTEGIVSRDLGKEGAALLTKWERTGLLEGLNNDHTRSSMARLLENQAKELLREVSSMAGSDVEGFASVAFPIVRRVFGGLIANDLVSVQPMSLPSGLIFFLDFQVTPGTAPRLGANDDDSLFGGGVVGSALTGGVNLVGDNVEKGFYNLNQGYSSPTASLPLQLIPIASGVVGSGILDDAAGAITDSTWKDSTATSLSELCQYDPDLSGSTVVVCTAPGNVILGGGGATNSGSLNKHNLIAMTIQNGTSAGQVNTTAGSGYVRQHRRLTTMVGRSTATKDYGLNALEPHDVANTSFVFVFESTGSASGAGATATGHAFALAQQLRYADDTTSTSAEPKGFDYPIMDNLDNVGERALGALVGNDTWGLENDAGIPEIDIKVDSIAITAVTKKLKAKWTPELGQDLNAYHNLDAEVELTGILSEQIALEIDREIVNDLVKGASAGTYYWSRSPGLFVRRDTGAEIGASSAAPDFTGTVSEWYETLVETINDVSAQIHRKTLRGGANFLVCSPEVANILEFTSGFRANITHDDDKGTVGAVNAGSISKKFDVWVDPYFPRNVVLVGRRGNSFLESGYVYAPYVPLQTTPTIFGTEDFVPRKGVMTRYGKKMVRPDMYGLVIVRGLLGEAGATS